MTTDTVSPLRQRLIEDMYARKLCAGTQKGHIRSCKQFAAFLKRSPDTATLEDIRRFQLRLVETGVSICTGNRIMTGQLQTWTMSRCGDHSVHTGNAVMGGWAYATHRFRFSPRTA